MREVAVAFTRVQPIQLTLSGSPREVGGPEVGPRGC
jgi:hypothetical protein